MSVFRETEIEWRGEKYKLVPSMQLLRAIELQGISLMHVEWQVATGKPQASLMATIMALVLASAGVDDIGEDEVYQEIRSADPKQALRTYNAIMAALSPVDKTAKKDEAPDAEAA
jgi:hypothetical protein